MSGFSCQVAPMVERCPTCGKVLVFGSKSVGQTVPCPKCQTPIVVQQRSAEEAFALIRRRKDRRHKGK